MKVAFIGLGNMGGPMACNIARSSHDLTVFDLDPAKMQEAVTAGATAGRQITTASSAAAAVADADVVMTSLPSPKIIEAAALGEDGILQAMSEGSTLIELSTNNLVCEARIRTAAEAHGVNLLDAPISGGIEGAAAGTLMIMVGGQTTVFDAHKDLLQLIGDRVIHLGGHGAGYVAKISQVVLCYLNSVALSEALMLGAKGGVDITKMLEIIQGSTGASYVADRYGPALLDGSYDPGFALGLAHKDLALTMELGASVDATLPMCAQVEAQYREAKQKYGEDCNHLMAIRLLEEANGKDLRP